MLVISTKRLKNHKQKRFDRLSLLQNFSHNLTKVFLIVSSEYKKSIYIKYCMTKPVVKRHGMSFIILQNVTSVYWLDTEVKHVVRAESQAAKNTHNPQITWLVSQLGFAC